MERYNIALVPTEEDRDAFIQRAKEVSGTLPDNKYLLGDNSQPHVSLCHFEAESDAAAEKIWKEVSALDLPTLSLVFDQQRSKSFPGHPKDGGVCWVSLISDQLEELKEIHLQIADIVKTPLNGAFDNYDPHMTLLNSRLADVSVDINELSAVNPALESAFTVALGRLDDVGQISEILFEQEASRPRYGMQIGLNVQR